MTSIATLLVKEKDLRGPAMRPQQKAETRQVPGWPCPGSRRVLRALGPGVLSERPTPARQLSGRHRREMTPPPQEACDSLRLLGQSSRKGGDCGTG